MIIKISSLLIVTDNRGTRYLRWLINKEKNLLNRTLIRQPLLMNLKFFFVKKVNLSTIVSTYQHDFRLLEHIKHR